MTTYVRSCIWENLVLPYGNNKSADQPACPSSLISTFVVSCLNSIIYLVSFIQNFKPLATLCSSAGQFESYLVKSPEDRFSGDEAHIAPLLTIISSYSPSGEDQAGYIPAEEREHTDGHQTGCRGTHTATGQVKRQNLTEQTGTFCKHFSSSLLVYVKSYEAFVIFIEQRWVEQWNI